MSRSSVQLTGYAALAFVTSALVQVVGMLAARLIAPFVGVSRYSWTTITGVILTDLSVFAGWNG